MAVEFAVENGLSIPHNGCPCSEQLNLGNILVLKSDENAEQGEHAKDYRVKNDHPLVINIEL